MRELRWTGFYFIVRAKREQGIIFFRRVNVFQDRHSWRHAFKRYPFWQIVVQFHDAFHVVRVVEFVVIHSFDSETADQFIPVEFSLFYHF